MNTILITGTNRGIGLELVKQYAEDGWKVFACSRAPNQADSLNELKFKHNLIEILQLDVSDPAQIASLSIHVQNNPIDILFNNAGVWGPHHQVFGESDAAAWLEVFKVNTIAPQLLAEKLINNIANSQLKIIANMDSGLGSITENTQGNFPIYRSSKSALNALTKTMSIDLKDQKIKVVSLSPGWVKTDMGGPNALTTVEECVKGLKHVLSQLTLEDSGSFFSYDGRRLGW